MFNTSQFQGNRLLLYFHYNFKFMIRKDIFYSILLFFFNSHIFGIIVEVVS